MVNSSRKPFLPVLHNEAGLETDYLLWDEVVGESRVNLMGEAEGRQQLPTALTEGILHKCIALITARKLFPLIIGGIWEECKPHVTGVSNIVLMETAISVQGRMSELCKWVTNLPCSTC